MKKILVVDDEKDIQTYLKKLLEENGYSVSCAADGEEAMKCVKKERPDLITLDMSMPNKSGIKFYKEIRDDGATKDIPVVVVTGITGIGGSADTERFLKTRGGIPEPDGFIPKPVDRDELLGAIGRLVK